METVKDLNFLDTLLPLAVIIFIIAIGVVLLNQHFQKNLYQQKLAQKALKSKYQNELLKTTIDIQEEERNRIAQDIHDELGAVISIIRMNLVMLEEQSAPDDEKVLAGLKNARSLSENALTSIRRISHRLMPPQLKAFGLIKTLESVIDQINKTAFLKINLNSSDDLKGLPWDVKLGIYRILMELINNTIKHAKATKIDIHLFCKENFIHCDYTDNGIGLLHQPEKIGLGRKGIEGRISSLEGILKSGNRSEGGFYTKFQIPVPNNCSPLKDY
ncbi:MAG: histidine kinase [Pelobium sp.]